MINPNTSTITHSSNLSPVTTKPKTQHHHQYRILSMHIVTVRKSINQALPFPPSGAIKAGPQGWHTPLAANQVEGREELKGVL